MISNFASWKTLNNVFIATFASQFSMQKDLPVLEVELDVDEMAKNHKA